MSLDDLPPQPAAHTPGGRAYGPRVLEKSRPVLLSGHGLLDRAYGPDYWQKVDVFPAEPARTPAPIVAFAHGGAWIAGYKEWMAFMAPAITALGAVFVSVSYRLAPESPHPEPLEDCASAVAWCWQHAAEFGGDPSRIYLGGHSAGAHLMSLLALRPELLVARGVPPGVVRGCLAQSAAFDLRPGQGAASLQPEDVAPLLRSTDDAADASPILHVSRAAPPFLISIGENDFPALHAQAAPMRAALGEHGVPVTLVEFPGHDHFDANDRTVEPGHVWLEHVAHMLRKP